jgi:tetratricopeptide (TPR) repeat protein
VEKVRASRGLSPPCAGDACPAAAPDAAAGGAPAAAPQPVPDALAEQAYERLVEYFVLVAQRLKTGEIPALNPDLPEPPEAYLAKAEEKYREAKALLADCLSLDAAYGVALARYGLGANDPATRAAAKAVLQDVQRGASGLLVSLLDPLFYLGLIYRHDREIDKAREVFNDIYRQDNTYPGVFMMQVQLSFSPQMLREQLPTFRQQLETKPDNEEFLLRVGVAAFYAEQYDLALETFQTILRLNPDSADANHYLGRVYFVRRQYAEAKTYLLKAIEKTVTPVASYYLFLGWLYEVEENYGEAIRNLKTAKSLDDTAWEVYWRLGEIYARLRVADADDSAASLFARAAELNPSSASVQASLGRYFEASSDPVAATHYQKALELQALTPELSPAELGAIHTALGKLWRGDRPADAANEFRQALKLGLRIEDETRVKERRPTLLYTVRWYWEAAYWLAQVLRDQNNLPQAAMYFRWVLPYVAGQPEETTARRALAVIEQVIPPDMIRDPGLLRTLDPLP